jgi:hypothetical protein
MKRKLLSFLVTFDTKWSDRRSDYEKEEDFMLVFEDWTVLEILFK